MPILFRCHACHRRLSVARRKAGTLCHCPTCQAKITIPFSEDKQDTSPSSRPIASVAADSKSSRVARQQLSGHVLGITGYVTAAVVIAFAALWMASSDSPQPLISATALGATTVQGDTSAEAITPTALRPSDASRQIGERQEGLQDQVDIAHTEPNRDAAVEDDHSQLSDEENSHATKLVDIEPAPAEVNAPINTHASVEVSNTRAERALQNILGIKVTSDDPATIREDLLRLPSVAVNEKFLRSLEALSRNALGNKIDPKVKLIKDYPELAGLPWIMGDECKSAPERSHWLDRFTKYIRRSAPGYFHVTEAPGANQTLDSIRQQEMHELQVKILGKQPITLATEPKSGMTYVNNRIIAGGTATLGGFLGEEVVDLDFRSPNAVAALRQSLPAHDPVAGALLVKALAQIDSPEATAVLANSAIFNLDSQVRVSAAEALAHRPEKDFRDELLRGLRYPLNHVVRNAADVIAQIRLTSFADELDQLLAGDSPGYPFVQQTEDGPMDVVREVVQVHHHKNCLLCHEPAQRPATMPMPLLVASTPPENEDFRTLDYLDAKSDPSKLFAEPYYDPKPKGNSFVFAGVTYLRPDFSVFQNVKLAADRTNGDGKMVRQIIHHARYQTRFDYLVRVRPARPNDFITHSRDNSQDYFETLREARQSLNLVSN